MADLEMLQGLAQKLVVLQSCSLQEFGLAQEVLLTLFLEDQDLALPFFDLDTNVLVPRNLLDL